MQQQQCASTRQTRHTRQDNAYPLASLLHNFETGTFAMTKQREISSALCIADPNDSTFVRPAPARTLYLVRSSMVRTMFPPHHAAAELASVLVQRKWLRTTHRAEQRSSCLVRTSMVVLCYHLTPLQQTWPERYRATVHSRHNAPHCTQSRTDVEKPFFVGVTP